MHTICLHLSLHYTAGLHVVMLYTCTVLYLLCNLFCWQWRFSSRSWGSIFEVYGRQVYV